MKNTNFHLFLYEPETEWVLLLASHEARIFKTSFPKRERWMREWTFENPMGRKRKRDFLTDRAGSAFASDGPSPSRHSLTREKNPKTESQLRFLRTLSFFVQRHFGSGDFDRLTVIAEPHLGGLFRSTLSKGKVARRTHWIYKDLSYLPEKTFQKMLQQDFEKASLKNVFSSWRRKSLKLYEQALKH